MSEVHKVLKKNAIRALESLSKDNSSSLKEVFDSLDEMENLVRNLMWTVEEAMDSEWEEEYPEEEQIHQEWKE